MNFKTHLGLPQSYIFKWQLHVRVCVTHDKKKLISCFIFKDDNFCGWHETPSEKKKNLN